MITTSSGEGAEKKPLKPISNKSLLTRILLHKHILQE